MRVPEVSPRGVGRRSVTRKNYFEARFPGHGKFYSTKIESAEEGACCYDIMKLYSELEVVRGKRKTAVKLNYPEYSRTLRLEPLPDIRFRKEEAMEIILRQAQAAAKNLPESLRRSTPAVGNPSPGNRSSSHQNVHGKAKKDLSGVCTNRLNSQEMSDRVQQCNMAYKSKVIEKRKLERQMADINENPGVFYSPESCPDDFTDSMACLRQCLESAEQGYKSINSECLELRKLIADHNSKVIDKLLMDDNNDSSGRQRANEDERLPRLPEDCPSEEQIEFDSEVPISLWSSDDWIYNSYG